MTGLQRTQKGPCHTSLYLPALASSSRHWCLHIEQPQAQHPPTFTHLTIYIPSRSLRSASERHLVVPSQRGTKSLSRTFLFTVPGRWNELHSEQCLEICITSTSCACLPLYNVLLIVFLNCKSLWIKASAKWINANENENTHYMHSSAVLRVSRDLKLFHPRAYFLIFLLSYNTCLMLSSLWLIYLAKNI